MRPIQHQMQAKVILWAKDHDAVRAMIFCRSLAREKSPGDKWADLDFELLDTNITNTIDNIFLVDK